MQTTSSPFNVFVAPEAITAAAGKPFDIRLGVSITKVDKEKRTVRGRATAEVTDAHGQIVDYATAKAVIQTWKGNVREMHQPNAVGKALEVECVDATKEIFVTSYISKGAEDTWQKVLEGVLSEYSIGARAVVKTEKVDGKPVEKLYLTKMNELSVVDAGACPGCSFDIVKMDGEQPVIAQEMTAGELGEPAAADVSKLEGTVDPATPATVAEFAALLATPMAERVTRLEALIARGAEVVVQKRMESYDIRLALQAIACLEELVANEWWEAKYAENDGQPADPEAAAQIEMLRNAAELVLGFLISEFMGQFEAVSVEVAEGDVAEAAKAAHIAKRATAAAVLPNLSVLLEKVGRRHSKTDEQMLKSIHDNSVALGAECAAEKAVTVVAEVHAVEVPAAAATEQTPAPAGSDVTKLEGLLTETTKALTQAQDTIRAQAESLSAVTERIQRLEAQPMPGGPVTRAVPIAKSLGSATDAIEGADPEEVIKALQELAADPSATPAERDRIAQKLISFQMKTGTGRAVITRAGE